MSRVAQDLRGVELATRIGVRGPASFAVDRVMALSAAVAIGFPVMVKLNQSDAGDGVARAQDAAALTASVDALGLGRRRLLRRTKTAAVRFFWKRAGAWLTSGKIFELQQFIPGVPAMHMVAAWQGRLLAGVSFLKAVVNPQPFGPSTVIRHIENAEMRAPAAKLVKTLGLSGFASFDFVISKDDKPFLIELNPRCTPALHLGRLFGHDLCGSLTRHLGWLEESPETALLPKETAVALFPNEMERDPESAWLHSQSGVLHGIPWDDPDVVKHRYHGMLQLHPSHSRGIAHLLRTEDVNMAMPV
jgi:predicted ATP-grasp superfamily ATP-dependent carboligase